MGVHFLQTFIEKKVPGGCKDVNIGDIVKAKKGSRSNILVIDLKAMACKPLELYDLGRVTKKDVNGGDFAGFKTAWIKFLGRLERAGIKVIFVCDGALPGNWGKFTLFWLICVNIFFTIFPFIFCRIKEESLGQSKI